MAIARLAPDGETKAGAPQGQNCQTNPERGAAKCRANRCKTALGLALRLAELGQSLAKVAETNRRDTRQNCEMNPARGTAMGEISPKPSHFLAELTKSCPTLCAGLAPAASD
jgi:hypothetical protein